VFSKIEVSGPEAGGTTGIPALPVSGGTGMIKVAGSGESNSIEATPTVNVGLLTPTVPSGASAPDEVDENDPNIGPQTPKPASTPRSGVSASGSSSSSGGGSSSGGSVSGGTASSGAGSVQGTSTGGSSSGGSGSTSGGATGPDGAPVAGYGSLDETEAAWPRYLYAAMAVLGIAFVGGGFALSRRSTAPEAPTYRRQSEGD
jgi:hypothetical protein